MTNYFTLKLWSALAALTLLGSANVVAQENSASSTERTTVESATLGQTKNVHQCGNLFLAGQFTTDDLSKITEAGIKRVITLRTEGEIDWDEKAALKEVGLELIEVPFRGPETLSDEVFDKVRELLSDDKTATLFHCGSANRVGGAWLPFRVLDEGVELDIAIQEAKEIGLRTEGYQEKALDYIQRKKKERDEGAMSQTGINSRFLDPELDVDSFVKRFEIDNREVYAARNEIIRSIGLKEGQRIADVGAGTGLYSRLFAGVVGQPGWVYAIDISPRFIEHINATVVEKKIDNVTSVLCHADSIALPPASVDIAYVCDTYHHFEFPEQTTKSIYEALKPGGQLIVVDFQRIPGKSRDWILGHVRAGKEIVTSEIESTGFKYVEEVEIPGLEENYFLRFKK